MTPAAMIKKLEKHMKAVGVQRDKLDETIQELGSLKECCERAKECLQDARDALSELV